MQVSLNMAWFNNGNNEHNWPIGNVAEFEENREEVSLFQVETEWNNYFEAG